MTAIPLSDSLSSARAGPRFSPFQLLPYPSAHVPASVALQQHGSCTWVINANASKKEQIRVTKASAASRLQNGLPAFKQAAEPDAFGASIQPIHGADAFFSRDGQRHTSLEEGSARNEPVFTSKLEEILNKFRTREMPSDDLHSVRSKNGVPSSSAQSEMIAPPKDFFRERRLGMAAKGNAGGRPWGPENATSNVVDASPPLPGERKRVHSPASRIQSSARGEGRRSGDDLYAVGRRNEAAPSASQSDAIIHRRHSFRERRVGMMARGNAGVLHNTENAAPDASSTLPWKRQWVPSPDSKTRPFTRSRRDWAGAHVTKSSLQTNLEPRKYRHWSSNVKKTREAGTSSKLDEEAVVPEFNWMDSNEEDEVDTAAPIALEDVARSSSASTEAAQPLAGSSMSAAAGNPKPLMNGKIAAWHSHSIPSLPFEFQFSYSETPKIPIVRYREEPFSPFGPETMGRPWTGCAPLKKSKKNLPQFDSFRPPPVKKGVKYVQSPGPFRQGQSPKPARSREEIHGEPLTGEEIVELVDSCRSERRQLNLGRDGLTHNMLDLIHCHWKRRRAMKIRCIGVPTVDMDNVCFHIEDKTGGKIIYRSGGLVYLFRGRNYNYRDRPDIPLMLWRPITPMYPKLIKKAPVGLTAEEAEKLRALGQKVEPMCTLAKNGVYLTLVKDVRAAFRVDDLVRINCRGLNPSDYKKIGAKLRDLVPCVLLSFNDEQILMWKGTSTVSANADASAISKAEDVNHSEAESGMLPAACDGGDDEAQSTREEIKPHVLVDDTAGGSTFRSDSMSASPEGRPECLSSTGSINHDWSSADLREEGFSVPSEMNSSLQTALNEADREMDSPLEYRMLSQATSVIMPGGGIESNPASDSQFGKSRFVMESGASANDQVDEQRVPKPVLKLDKKTVESEASRAAGAGKEGLNSVFVIRVDALWDQAIASGIAIQLDQTDIDSDIVVKKASELDEANPTVAEYNVKLQKRLWIKRKTPPRQDDDLRMHFAKFYQAKLEKKAAKRAFRLRRPVDVPPADNGGLPVEELARLLSIK